MAKLVDSKFSGFEMKPIGNLPVRKSNPSTVQQNKARTNSKRKSPEIVFPNPPKRSLRIPDKPIAAPVRSSYPYLRDSWSKKKPLKNGSRKNWKKQGWKKQSSQSVPISTPIKCPVIGNERIGESYKERESVLWDMNYISYDDYKQSNLWDSIRRRVFELKGTKCCMCRNRANQIHHASYRMDVMTGQNIMPLFPICEYCHRRIEFNRDGTKRMFSEVQRYFRGCVK